MKEYLCGIWIDHIEETKADQWCFRYQWMTEQQFLDYIEEWKIGNPKWKDWINDFCMFETKQVNGWKKDALCD